MSVQEEKDLESNTITADMVSDYLKNNLDFFNKHPDVLAELNIPHDRGTAVSLVESRGGTSVSSSMLSVDSSDSENSEPNSSENEMVVSLSIDSLRGLYRRNSVTSVCASLEEDILCPRGMRMLQSSVEQI